MAASTVNTDLLAERQKCSFNPELITNFLEGGAVKTRRRRFLENIALNEAEFHHPSVTFLSREERYNLALSKGIHAIKVMKKYDIYHPEDAFIFRRIVTRHESSPLLLHSVMFIPTLLGQTTPEQSEKWLPLANNHEIIGTYAQTELGHGTFIRALETTAHYDKQKQEFILNTPTLTASKWWPGDLGKTVNYAIVIAQLYIDDKHEGLNAFLVQVRSLENHEPMSGITVGDIGPKFGYESNDNGFLRLNNVRIPRDQMMMRYAQVTPDGKYLRVKGSEKLLYGTMLFVRSVIVHDVGTALSQAATIATRYSAVRRQTPDVDGGVERQVLDYKTQQSILLPQIAASYALTIAGSFMRHTYFRINQQIEQGIYDELPLLHALSSGLKAVSSAAAVWGIELCRRSCGGHGYSEASGMSAIYRDVLPACTYEGDNTVLLLQTARYLLKLLQPKEGASTPRGAEYLVDLSLVDTLKATPLDLNDPQTLCRIHQLRTQRLLHFAAQKMQQKLESGGQMMEAWNHASPYLARASEAFSQTFIVTNFFDAINGIEKSSSIYPVMRTLATFYGVTTIIERTGDFVMAEALSTDQVVQLYEKWDQLMDVLRPDAVGLVDAFDWTDIVLDSCLGRFDGNVYEAMWDWARESPLNHTEVLEGHRKYLLPFLKENRSKL